MFDAVTAAASALYAAVRSVVCSAVGELVYGAVDGGSSVALPVRVVPLAKAVTRPFWNDASADALVGERPSALRVRKAALIAVSWPTVVPDLAWIAWTSVRRVCSAVLSAVFVAEF